MSSDTFYTSCSDYSVTKVLMLGNCIETVSLEIKDERRLTSNVANSSSSGGSS